jgi:hypothetical protein
MYPERNKLILGRIYMQFGRNTPWRGHVGLVVLPEFNGAGSDVLRKECFGKKAIGMFSDLIPQLALRI